MEKTIIRHDNFIDFNGNTHPFTVAAVLTDEVDDMCIVAGSAENMVATDAVACLTLGVAVCNPKDKWDEGKGACIAAGRARKYIDDALIINSRAMLGMLNDDAITALLEREAGYVKEHIGKYIPGYDEMARRHKANKELAEVKASLSAEEVKLVESAASSSDVVKGLLKRVLN